MESEKPGQSDGSSEEIDHRQVDKEQIRETTVGQASGKRLYECVFCKRGFTNAQALGGHMNIHRKDRAKSSSSFPSKQPPNPSYTAASAAHVARPFSFYPFEKSDSSDPWEAMRSKLPHNIVCPDNSYGRESDYLRTVHSGRNDHLDENLGSNLSLQIGSSHGENIDVAKDGEERDEIDLELRLGRDP